MVLSFPREAETFNDSYTMKKTKDIPSLQTLTELLKHNLPHVHRARLNAIALFVLSLICQVTVNLRKLSLSGIVDVKPDSVQKRLSRLLFWLGNSTVNLEILMLQLTNQLNPSSTKVLQKSTDLSQKCTNLSLLIP